MDSDAARHRGAPTANVLERGEKEKNKKDLEKCKAMRRDFTPLVYTVDFMAGKDAMGEEMRLAYHLAKKWQMEYSEMVGFVRERMSLSVVRSNTLLPRGQRINRGLMGRRPLWGCGAALGMACV